MEPRQLSPRQARWVELLSTFRFKIVYRPGKQAEMPDALSRRSDYHPGKGSTTDLKYNFVQALPNYIADPSTTELPESAAPVLRALQRPFSLDREYFVQDGDIHDGLAEDADISNIYFDMKSLICTSCSHPTCSIQPEHTILLESVAILRRRTRNQAFRLPRWNNHQFLCFSDKVYLPDHNDSRLKIIRARHDAPLAGHPGINGTIDLVSRDYIWAGLCEAIDAYVRGCTVCQRTKSSHQGPLGLLKPLEVPTRPWTELSMDFIEQLPKLENTTRSSLSSTA